jgi:hypothetical protein
MYCVCVSSSDLAAAKYWVQNNSLMPFAHVISVVVHCVHVSIRNEQHWPPWIRFHVSYYSGTCFEIMLECLNDKLSHKKRLGFQWHAVNKPVSGFRVISS